MIVPRRNVLALAAGSLCAAGPSLGSVAPKALDLADPATRLRNLILMRGAHCRAGWLKSPDPALDVRICALYKLPPAFGRARSSAGEHTLHTGGVVGSIPTAPTST